MTRRSCFQSKSRFRLARRECILYVVEDARTGTGRGRVVIGLRDNYYQVTAAAATQHLAAPDTLASPRPSRSGRTQDSNLPRTIINVWSPPNPLF